MNQPFELTEEGGVRISGASAIDAEVHAKSSRDELLEIRLQRIEAALGFSENPEHNDAIRAVIASL